MRRKYDERNKKNFIIIIILAILVVGVFSLFIYRYKHTSKIEYSVLADSIVIDTQKNKIEVVTDAKMKVRWNDYYYLDYQDNKINLSKNVIVYNKITGEFKLYGTFYEIDENGKIIINNNETILNNASDTKFYKLGDREYLLIDRKITSSDGSINAGEFLLVELDKLGNAKLSNNKLNLKTIKETVLETSKYTFDINNEVLNFGKKTIDLRKIIGSTNGYTKEEKKSNGEGTGTGGGENGTGGNGAGGPGGGNGTVINNHGGGNAVDINKIRDKTKKTSIIKTVEGLTKIDIDYVIYDPYNEYLSVYAEIFKPGTEEIIYLSKNENHLVIDKLTPNTKYTIIFKYVINNDEMENVIFDELNLTTKKPEYSISVYKLSKYSGILTYKINSLSGYTASNIQVNLSFHYKDINLETGDVDVIYKEISSVPNMESLSGSIDISSYNIDKDEVLDLRIVSVDGFTMNSNCSFRYGE